MSDNSHAAMCVYCGEAIIYDTREVTDMAAAHAAIVEHDQQCTINPLVARIEFLNKQNTEQQEQNDALAAHVELLSDNLQASINGIEWYKHNTSVDCGEADEEHLKYCEEAIKQTPSNSLARRDLIKQAEALEYETVRKDYTRFAVNKLLDSAEELRQQAAALYQQTSPPDEHPDCTIECGAYGTYCKCAAEGHQ